ncbi:MAG: flippase-like domain-containing protein [Anaerolineae bacterium]|jgi:glycosyltransferase 2 family protein|nr:flippase-like domain-containing protein [Anaerolineae bacterium]MBT7075629.1 flippase-like domain-containing protein [Anaerolineae bacterium]MBT7783781.1 flippase-like domain-containing protein [Anaerolineae bacterium]
MKENPFLETSMQKKKNEKKWWQWVGTIASILLFIWLLRKQNWLMIFKITQSVSWEILLGTFILFSLLQGLNALRWLVLLRAQRVTWSYWVTLKISLAGNFASNFLPSTVGGDSLRIMAVLRTSKEASSVISTVILDRLLNIISIFFLLPITWLTFREQLLTLLFNGAKTQELSLLAGFNNIAKKHLSSIINSTKELYQVWRAQNIAIFKGLGIALISNLLSMFTVWLLAIQMGISITYYQAIAIATISYLATLLPISMNGYGIRETIYTILYMNVGSSMEQATALAILSRFMVVLSTLPGAFFFSSIVITHND